MRRRLRACDLTPCSDLEQIVRDRAGTGSLDTDDALHLFDELLPQATPASPPPPPLPLLPDDLLVEILLRLPPEPIHLLRATLVCSHWRRLVHDARFLRRFRASHAGAPPVLGFLANQIFGAPVFVPTAGPLAVSPLPSGPSYWSAIDCRHGRVLLFREAWNELLVWDPITGDMHCLATPPAFASGFCNGTVLCEADHDDHGDCHSSPFLVVFVFTDNDDEDATAACIYSSETGAWGDVTSAIFPSSYLYQTQAIHVGNSLYFQLNDNDILEFDLERRNLELIEEPDDVPYPYYMDMDIILTLSLDGGLGLAGVEGFSLHLWSMATNRDGSKKWTPRKTIDLEDFLPLDAVSECRTSNRLPVTIGFAEDADLIFISAGHSVYTIHLKSMQSKKVVDSGNFGLIYPYTSFYTAGGLGVGGGDDLAEQLNNI